MRRGSTRRISCDGVYVGGGIWEGRDRGGTEGGEEGKEI